MNLYPNKKKILLTLEFNTSRSEDGDLVTNVDYTDTKDPERKQRTMIQR